MTTHLQFACQLARKSGKLLEGYFHAPELRTSLKADRSIVTEADTATDRLIAKTIQDQYPGDLLMSEELQPHYPADDQASGKAIWIIDPLDGTTNFSLGLHTWGVLMARIVNGWPETAVLFFPMLGELYSAQRGEGAFQNNQRILIEPLKKERSLPFFACCSRTFRRYQVSVPYKVRILGSAAYTFCAVARGSAVLGFEATPKIWDIAAAWLLVGEAGGAIGTLDGSQPFPLRPGINYAALSFPTLAAATPALLDKAHRQIQPIR